MAIKMSETVSSAGSTKAVTHLACHVMSSSVTALSLFQRVAGFVAGAKLSPSKGRALPGRVASSSHEQLGFSMGFEPATFWSLADLLYLLSYSRPLSVFSLWMLVVTKETCCVGYNATNDMSFTTCYRGIIDYSDHSQSTDGCWGVFRSVICQVTISVLEY